MIRHWSKYAIALPLAGVLWLSLMSSIGSGAMPLSLSQSMWSLWDGLFGTDHSGLSGYEQIVVMELRLPRTLLAMMVGALLAQCGAVMQGVFRNPLADPGIIGVSSGAALGAAICIVLLPASISAYALPIAGFGGGLLVTLMVYKLAQGPAGTSVTLLLLAGVAIAGFAGAMIGFLTFIASEQGLRDLSLWQMGSVASASDTELGLMAAVTVILMVCFQFKASALNALLLGESEARHLGIDVERMKRQFILLTALGVGIAVSVSGIIGFVGLVIPHIVRTLVGPNHTRLLPICAVLGAALMLIADSIARVAMSPSEMPVGLVTAAIGSPFFMALLYRMRRRIF
ncbi:FecCD family ABC transporter permease [Echinimonas agarilytica]|uniref:Iron ABC transporter permease n=1 Tax=Echinimonas agarilytica TaxID=1215918 RepID=A0AA41W687_9GAMM|nr:iron ABC transporter permease [Echinimonas agarilytica]MCM2679602.1 iron ABC transporter permease [Echinimonas agarilytica]